MWQNQSNNFRTIDVNEVYDTLKEALFTINTQINSTILKKYQDSYLSEKNDTARFSLNLLMKNSELAKEKSVPLCQDTGMVVVFMEVGQQVQFVNGDINESVQQATRDAYVNHCFRKSVVNDPIFNRTNTMDNTPAIIHYDIVAGNRVKMTIIAKGFGSENVSKSYMMKPTSSVEDISSQIIETIVQAGPNACPPFVVGVGVGGTLEKASLLAKKATAKNSYHHDQKYECLERDLEKRMNQLQIGPLGFKGDLTVISLRILEFPTHIAGLPLVVNVCCHQSRHTEVIL